MRTHPEQLDNEIYLGNHSTINGDVKQDLKALKTIRLGKAAYCLNGKALKPKHYPILLKPLFINKSEVAAYDRIMLNRSKN